MTRRARIAIAAAAVAAAAATAALVRRGGDDAGAPAARPERVRPVAGAELRVARLTATPAHVIVGEPVRLAADVERGTGRAGAVRWRWAVPAGALDADDAAEVVWTAPGKPGRYTVGVAVEDDHGRVTGRAVVEVRLPSPREAAELGPLVQRLAARRDAEVADLAALERRIDELRAVGELRASIEDRLRAARAYEELADVLTQLGRYEEALDAWRVRTAGMLPTDSSYGSAQAKIGDLAFFLGDEDGALAAWEAGRVYTQGMSRYYQAELLERRGDVDGALEAYAIAADGLRGFGDPVYRHALLLLEAGAAPDAVAAMLIDASPRLDRERMLDRLDGDPELAALRRLLAGREGELAGARPEVIEAGAPGATGT